MFIKLIEFSCKFDCKYFIFIMNFSVEFSTVLLCGLNPKIYLFSWFLLCTDYLWFLNLPLSWFCIKTYLLPFCNILINHSLYSRHPINCDLVCAGPAEVHDGDQGQTVPPVHPPLHLVHPHLHVELLLPDQHPPTPRLGNI